MIEGLDTTIKVTLDPRIFKILGRREYRNHPVTIAVRELLQNSRDACYRRSVTPEIDISIRDGNHGNKTGLWVTCQDNGDGMTPEVIVNKFLKAGAPKDFNGQIGGFGIAKFVIFASEFWQVQTLDYTFDYDNFVAGDKIQYSDNHLDGTRISVFIASGGNLYFYRWNLDKTLAMILYSNVPVNLKVEACGIEISEECKGFSLTVKPDHAGENWIAGLITESMVIDTVELPYYDVIRSGGLVQYVNDTGDRRKVSAIIDIDTQGKDPSAADYPLTANREGLTGRMYGEVAGYIAQQDENPLWTQLRARQEKDTVRPVPGKLLSGLLPEDNSTPICLMSSLLDLGKLFQMLSSDKDSEGDGIKTLYHNCDTVTPDDRRILRAWTAIIPLACASNDHFGVGLTKERGVQAYCYTYNGDSYYLVNPEKFGNIPSKDGIILALWSLACHEATHFKQESHNEIFTAIMGDKMISSAASISASIAQIKRVILKRLSYAKD